MLSPGQHLISGKVQLPHLHKGLYYMDIGVADPGIQTYVEFHYGIQLIYDGLPMMTGQVFSYGKGSGYQVLEGEISLQDISEKTQ